MQRVDIDAIVEETELGTIVARSTSGFAGEAVDAARARTAEAERSSTRVVDRMFRRRGEAPLGPPLLVRDDEADDVERGGDALRRRRPSPR